MTNRLLHGRSLLAARAAWVAVVIPTLSLTAWAFATVMARPERFIPPEIEEALGVLGLTGRTGALVFTVPPMVFFALTSLVLFWRRSNDAMAILSSLALAVLGAMGGRWLFALEDAYPSTASVVRVLGVLGLIALVLMASLFPNGRFEPPWTRFLPFAALAAVAALPDLVEFSVRLAFGEISGSHPTWRRWAMPFVLYGLFAAALVGQVQRYRRYSGPVERQQAKWVGFSFAIVNVVIWQGLVVQLIVGGPVPWSTWSLFAGAFALNFCQVALAVAIFRYRLYEIDRIIGRTATYAIVTALLAGLYALVALVVPGAVFGSADTPDWIIAGATLLVAAAFVPVRRRVQRAVDRRFNRGRYDAARTIDAFGARLREEVDIDALGAELAGIVKQTMQPVHASLWLRPGQPR